METKTNSVDIAIPCLNAQNTVSQAIKSIINEPLVNKIIIGDNSSDDQLESCIRDFDNKKLFYVRFDNRVSMLENWLRTARLSTAKYVKILPADDQLLPDSIHHDFCQIESLQCKVALLSSPRIIKHPNKVVQTILDKSINRTQKKNPTIIAVTHFDKYQATQSRNILGEPSCVLFVGHLLRKLANDKHLLSAILEEQAFIPYAADLILYKYYLKLADPCSYVFLTSKPGSTFTISKNTGTWRMRKRQSDDLIKFFELASIKPTTTSHIKITIRSAIRDALYRLS